MKLGLYYFSGTLNTERVALALAKNWGGTCALYRLQFPWEKVPDPKAFDVLGIGYPIHAFNTPKVVLDFFADFPPAESPKKYFLFKVSGEPLHFNDYSSKALIRLLEKKGYFCIQEFHYLMPYNILFRHSDNMATKMWSYAQRMAQYNLRKIGLGIEEPPHFRFGQGWYIIPFRIEWPFAKTNGRHFRVDPAKCIQCGLCVKVCPMSNVSLSGKQIHFGGRCSLCMACSFLCPTEAIRPGIFHRSWLVNGSYPLERMEQDPGIPSWNESHEKHFNRAYDLYFKKCDRLLANPPDAPKTSSSK